MKAWLHVVSVGARAEENRGEPDFTDSGNINFVPAARQPLVKSTTDKDGRKTTPKTPLLYRSVKSTRNTKWEKSVLDRIVSATRFGATFF